MADNAASSQQQEDELSLPRAAVNKMIKEMIPNIRISNDARELVLNCCTEFIHLIASESNEICNKQTKKTISPEHVISALDSLGFQDYVKDVEGVYKQFKTQTQKRKLTNKMKNQGVSEEELLRQQQELFARAREQQAQEDWLNMQQQQRLAGNDPNAPLGMIPNMLPQQEPVAQLPADYQQHQGFPLQQQQQQLHEEQQPPPQLSLTNFQPPTGTGDNNMDYDSGNANEGVKDT